VRPVFYHRDVPFLLALLASFDPATSRPGGLGEGSSVGLVDQLEVDVQRAVRFRGSAISRRQR
jgi:hypothetical protein